VARTYVAVIEFSVNGKSYAIDLGKKNAAEFHRSLDKYIAAASKVGGAKARKPSRGGKEDLAAIRAWGRGNGFQVSDRGRVSSELRDAYSKAQ